MFFSCISCCFVRIFCCFLFVSCKFCFVNGSTFRLDNYNVSDLSCISRVNQLVWKNHPVLWNATLTKLHCKRVNKSDKKVCASNNGEFRPEYEREFLFTNSQKIHHDTNGQEVYLMNALMYKCLGLQRPLYHFAVVLRQSI